MSATPRPGDTVTGIPVGALAPVDGGRAGGAAMTGYCPVCRCERRGARATCGSWICAVALAYGWPEPLPRLPRPDEVPQLPATAPCGVCGAPMPRLDYRRKRERQFCSTTCSNRHKAKLQAQQRERHLEDVLDLLDMGESLESIGPRLGVTTATMARRMEKAGRRDLANAFERARHKKRPPRARAKSPW